MPHADSSLFAAGASKEQVYDQVLEQTQGLVTGQRNWVSNLANVSSLLWHAYASLPKPSSGVNWAGFYVRDDLFPLLASPKRSNSISGLTTTTITTSYASHDEKKLLLGPFQGKTACQEIKFGRGVCGTAALKKETVIVPDVLEFPGHIACDAESRSEIVVPIIFEGETVAIIDIDCTEPSGFDETDKNYLERLAQLLSESCDCFVFLTTIQSTWSAVPPESPVPPWPTSSSGSLTKDSSTDVLPNSSRQQNESQQHNFIFDFSFEHDSFSSSSSSSSPSVLLSDHSASSLWSDTCAAPESLDQLAGTLDFDFLLSGPTSALGATNSQYLETSVAAGQRGELNFDLSLDFGSTEHTSFDIATTQHQAGSGFFPAINIVEDVSTCSPANMSEGGSVLSHPTTSIDLANLGPDHFYSTTNTPAVSSTSPTMNMALSPLSMTSIPSQDHHQQQRQPLLAPKKYTPSSSTSVSPALSNAITIAANPGNSMQSKPTKKRSHATAEDLSSNNSAQDSEEERLVEKRRRNTMAARRFRKRKQDHVEDLQEQLSTVTKERDDLRLQVAKWEGEVMALRKLLEMKK